MGEPGTSGTTAAGRDSSRGSIRGSSDDPRPARAVDRRGHPAGPPPGDLAVDLSGDDVVVDLTGPVARVWRRPRPWWLSEAWVLYAALVVLNLLDVVTTAAVLAAGGAEGNPVVRPYVDNGLGTVFGAKLLVLAVVAYLLTHSRGSRITDWALTFTTGWYLAVVTWNCWVLLGL
ncbi:MAG: hypothetical protein D6683_16830 [Actinomyces sp.]|nr:MAG: hypothetical protein D6683_16830 [Actinomyces sp.]